MKSVMRPCPGLKIVLAYCGVCAVLSLPQQTLSQDRDEFSVMQFSPALGPNNYMQVEGAETRGHLAPTLGLTVDYAHDPFVLYDVACDSPDEANCRVGQKAASIVEYSLAFHLQGGLALWNRVYVGLDVPLILMSGQGYAWTSPRGPESIAAGTGFAVGDPRLSIKGNLLTHESFALGVLVYGTAPLAQAMVDQKYIGDSSFTFGGTAVAELLLKTFRVSANIGANYRPEQRLFSSSVGPRLQYGLGARYDFTTHWAMLIEGVGTSAFVNDFDEHSIEVRAALRIQLDAVSTQLGGGAGLTRGVGTPPFRIHGQLMWSPDTTDSDGDGILDRKDRCPTEPEDKDNYADQDGCPETDNDGDQIPDVDDKCPEQAEDKDGKDDADGCPETDNDQDGISDGYDACPNVPEDMDGDKDEDGCPDHDTDRDGVPDDKDKCPDSQEDTDGFDDEDGCPEADVDGDGVTDDTDSCPEQAEDMDGYEDEDGCPEEGTRRSRRR